VRVLVLPKEFPSAERPNAGIFILRRVRALLELGHEIEVLRIVPFAPALGKKWRAYGSIPAHEIVDGVAVRTIRAIVPPRMVGMEYLPLQVHGAVQREIARFHPDVLHASFLIPSGQIAVRHALPTVVTAHGGDAYLWPTWRKGLFNAAREAIAGATRVTAVSAYIAECVRKIYDRGVDVIINGADERHFFPRERAQCRAQLDLPHDRAIIAYAGNLFRRKGVFDLANAVGGMNAVRPLLVLAGEGPDESDLREAAAHAGIDIRFAGRLDGEGISKLFAAADVVTLPSHNEGLPNVICEAMLCGRAVVATKAGGIPEIVQHRRTGLLVGVERPQELRDALTRILSDSALRQAFERAARDYAAQHLTWSISAKGYERAYERAMRDYEEASRRRSIAERVSSSAFQ
jgi:teichuronic acid biosynthesis glycosyltransferase TuaC